MKSGVVGLIFVIAPVLQAQPGSGAYPAARTGGNYMRNYYLPPSPSGSPWWPAWSPDGRWIAIAMHGSIWKVDVRTGAAAELTHGREYHSSPGWSPDGKWIVYTADDDDKKIQLALVETATGRARPLTDDGHVYSDPSFSPDGTRLAYVSTHPNGYFNIYVRPFRDGAWAGEPTAITRDSRYPSDRLYVGQLDMHIEPAWTPDGKELVFLTNRGMPLGSGGLWRMPAVQDGIDKAVPVHREATAYRSRPDVSPDGKRIVYSSNGGGADQFENLYVLPVQGGIPYKLTLEPYDHFHPRWSPDAEWIAFLSNEEGLPQLVLLETNGGARRRLPAAPRTWKRPMGKVRITVLDAGAGEPVRSWLHTQASDGKFYAPSGVYARVAANGRRQFDADGVSEFDVPAGRLLVEAARGFEYAPASGEAEVKPSDVAELVLRLNRIDSPRVRGWRPGSLHSHLNYGGNLHNTLENLLRMARASDVDVVNALVANRDARVLDYQHFVPGGGEHPAGKAAPGIALFVGQEYRPPLYGHVSLIGLREHLLTPGATGYEGTAIESLYPSNTDMLRKARAQGALTTYVHPFTGDLDPLEGDLGVGKSFPVDAALGTVDALEWSWANHATFPVIAHAWNNDLRIAPVGGEDSITNLHRSNLLGSARTYVHTGSRTDGESWLDGIRKGRTFYTTGPLLEFAVNGGLPGDEIRLDAPGGRVKIRCRARSFAPLTTVALYWSGSRVKEIPLSRDGREASWEGEHAVAGSGWFALVAEGPPHPAIAGGYPQAVTNAVRVYVGSGKIRNRQSARYFIRWIDALERVTRDWRWWRNEKELRHVLAQYEQARSFYRALMEEAP